MSDNKHKEYCKRIEIKRGDLSGLTHQYTKEETEFFEKYNLAESYEVPAMDPSLNFIPDLRKTEEIYRNAGLPGIPAFDGYFSKDEEEENEI